MKVSNVKVQFVDTNKKEVTRSTYESGNLYQITELWYCRFDLNKEEVKRRCLVTAQANAMGLLNDCSKPCKKVEDNKVGDKNLDTNKIGVAFLPKSSLELLGDKYLKTNAFVTSPELYDEIIYPLYQDLKLLADNEYYSPFNPILRISANGRRQYRQDVISLEKRTYQECIEEYEEALGLWINEMEKEEMFVTETDYLSKWNPYNKWMIYLREEPKKLYLLKLVNEIDTRMWYSDDLDVRNEEFIKAVESNNIVYMITLLSVGVNLFYHNMRGVRLMSKEMRKDFYKLIGETRADKVKKYL